MSNYLGPKDYFFGIAGFCISITLDFMTKIVKTLETEKVHICRKGVMEMLYLIIITVNTILNLKKGPIS